MVSFSCEGCGDVLTKKKLDPHRNQCRGATFTCWDCMTHFQGTQYREHTSCISEAQKYQGALYRPKDEKKAKPSGPKPTIPRKAYIEDDPDEYTGALAIFEAPPAVPSPPSAALEFDKSSEPVNVFDFFIGSETPNQSTLNLAAVEQSRMIEDGPLSPTTGNAAAVRFQGLDIEAEDGALVQYGAGPVPTTSYRTPAAKVERRKKERNLETDETKDKKRKRLHVDTSQEYHPTDADEVMTDAPPVLHSGLTGGLRGLLARPAIFPPSPDYSGGDAGDNSPASPLKRTRHSRRERESRADAFSNTIMSLITPRNSSKELDENRPRKQHRRPRRTSAEQTTQKMIEYKPANGSAKGDTNEENSQQMVLFESTARAELFMSFVKKGPESEKGCSVNKALKRYHRERGVLGHGIGRFEEEKELWRSLRLRKNDRGEVVVFF